MVAIMFGCSQCVQLGRVHWKHRTSAWRVTWLHSMPCADCSLYEPYLSIGLDDGGGEIVDTKMRWFRARWVEE
jgi:hypothetical protein